ncbi:NUDIX domain-containing protein [Helicovermis profundi]|uniref:Nudix hydrolase domain-containing protein n=1 Tax=Helicovermis profundi TaxID=3065157 RepID=A0AAU9E2P2_9FIRM|nr:hypothetical protein HLPR_09290 [Clostridia bacterium S502]
MNKIRSFGIKENKYTYIERKGVYGLEYKDDKVFLVKSPLGYFALGGGIEPGESEEECLRREVIEEVGKFIEIGEFLEEVIEYVHVKGSEKSYKKIMKFYRIDLKENYDGKIEEDHELVELSVEDAINKMFLKGQAYVVKKYAK